MSHRASILPPGRCSEDGARGGVDRPDVSIDQRTTINQQTQSEDEIDLPSSDEVFDAPVISVTPAEPEPIALRGEAGERQAVSITRIAHSSVLVDFAGKLVLTDPWFTETSEYYHGEPLAMGWNSCLA